MGKYKDISDVVMIDIKHVSKIYRLYDKPIDRLKEAVSIRHKKRHREHYALRDLNIRIMKGESIGIVGVNGAGKSTLLKIITGVLNPTQGEVITNGKIAALLELGAGFNPEYTGMENIFLNGTMMGYTQEEMEQRVDKIVEFADIGEFIHQPVKTYSSGMFARLAFAVSINVDPEILIVDEALSVGDMRFQIKCMEKMKQMMEGGTTVLFVSHDINSIRRFCTKVIWMKNGTLERMGDVNEVSDQYLDFLKLGDALVEDNDNKTVEEKQEENKKRSIAEILNFQLKDTETKNEVEQITINQDVYVEVNYEVYDEVINNPVVGIAIRSMDDDYVCGLNTLLDEKKVPWEKGKNRIELHYPHGILALGGQYYFDVAIYDETATVPIQYISAVKKFTISAGYKGEGRYIIPHTWEA